MRFCLISFLTCIITLQSIGQEKFKIEKILLDGNNITKAPIIMRELTFAKDSSYSLDEMKRHIKKSKENLINLKLFNFIDISTVTYDKTIQASIKVVERWYVWPYPIIEISERNFNVWWSEFKESNYSDFSRLNYGIFLVWENFYGKNQLLKLKYRRGFKEHYLFNYEIPYFNKNKKIGLNLFAQQFRKKKSFYSTNNNQLVYYEEGERYTTKDYEFQIDVLYRETPRKKHEIGLHYLQSNILDSIAILNPEYLKNKKMKGNYFKIRYMYENEERDYSEYPLHGHYLNLEIHKNIAKTSPVNDLRLTGRFEKHLEIRNGWFLGSSFKGFICSDKSAPYFSRKGFGFDDYVRSYEYYVIDGYKYWLSKTAIKLALFEKTTFNIPYIKMSQFKKAHFSLYLSVFSDLGYIVDQKIENNPLANTLLFGKGVSLDYVTYYDKVLRIEFSVNRLGEKGIFLHFTNPFN